ncbi:MAG: PqqD family protein [Rhodobacteraceae bacterium]|nr:PqqD family protein [Paracoccaceae bacterium]
MFEKSGVSEGAQANSPEPVIFRDRFMFDPRSGMFFSISEEGAWILRQLIAGRNRRDVETGLVERYGIDRGAAMRDVEHFAARVGELGLIPAGSRG